MIQLPYMVVYIARQFLQLKSNPSSAHLILAQLEVATATLVDTVDIEPLVTIHCMNCMASYTVVA